MENFRKMEEILRVANKHLLHLNGGKLPNIIWKYPNLDNDILRQ